MSLTLKQQLALAALKGDDAAAYALADQLIEERNDGVGVAQEAARALRMRSGITSQDSYAVYHWPEFQEFARRLGLMYDLRTIDVSIHLRHGEMVLIEQRYAGVDTDVPPVPTAISTTNAHNEEFHTAVPPAARTQES